MDEIRTIKRKGSDKGAERVSKVPRTAPDPIRVPSNDERSNSKAHKTDSPRVFSDDRRGGSDERTSEENVLRDKVRTCSGTVPLFPFKACDMSK